MWALDTAGISISEPLTAGLFYAGLDKGIGA